MVMYWYKIVVLNYSKLNNIVDSFIKMYQNKQLHCNWNGKSVNIITSNC